MFGYKAKIGLLFKEHWQVGSLERLLRLVIRWCHFKTPVCSQHLHRLTWGIGRPLSWWATRHLPGLRALLIAWWLLHLTPDLTLMAESLNVQSVNIFWPWSQTPTRSQMTIWGKLDFLFSFATYSFINLFVYFLWGVQTFEAKSI